MLIASKFGSLEIVPQVSLLNSNVRSFVDIAVSSQLVLLALRTAPKVFVSAH